MVVVVVEPKCDLHVCKDEARYFDFKLLFNLFILEEEVEVRSGEPKHRCIIIMDSDP